MPGEECKPIYCVYEPERGRDVSADIHSDVDAVPGILARDNQSGNIQDVKIVLKAGT